MNKVWCFKCKECGIKEEWEWSDTHFRCSNPNCPPGTMVRDYKAESVGINRDNIRAAK